MRATLPRTLLGGSWLVLLTLGCGQQRVRIIGELPGDAATPASCPPTLAARLGLVEIAVDKNIAWQKPGYDYFPVDERVALAVQPDGQALLAWAEVNAATVAGGSPQPPLGVHVTPLDGSLARRGADTVLATAQEVSGLVAHDDGFALLTRDANPGTRLDLGEGEGNNLAFLLRYQGGQVQWRQPLTGSASLDAEQTGTLYSPFLEGQLVWNDSIYGAYFVVRGGQGDPSAGFYRDALVFRDSMLRPAIWPVAHGCDNNGGIRLIADSGKANLVSAGLSTVPQMTGLCIQQLKPLLKLTNLESDRVVSDQELGRSGYAGARLGSLLKLADGYLVFWLSMGDTNDDQGHDIRMARLDGSFNVTSGPGWFARTPGREEWNLHVVPYGPSLDRFLMVYGEIEITGSAGGNNAMFTGRFLGTHLVLIDANGTPLSANELVPKAPTTANAEPVVLPGGDVAWPFVNPTPDYTSTVAGPNGPGQTTLRIARVRYCQ
jgi:hypothetical protein